jgi:putative transposase
MYLNEVYFWTSTIFQWKHLLKPDKYKLILINSLINLTERKKIKVYGFVIMPNHIHLLWEMTEMNGREMPYASFQKHTAHAIQCDLKVNHPYTLRDFKVDENERHYRFWQRDPLAIPILSREMAEQKLEYIHLNPLQSHWNLCETQIEYYYSSGSFYESNASDFNFISDYRTRM